MFSDKLHVEPVKQIVGSVATSHRCDDAGPAIGEGSMKIIESLFRSSRKIQWAASLSADAELGIKTQCSEPFSPTLDAFLVRKRRRSNDTDARIFLNSGRLYQRLRRWQRIHGCHASPRAISDAGPVRYSSVPR